MISVTEECVLLPYEVDSTRDGILVSLMLRC